MEFCEAYSLGTQSFTFDFKYSGGEILSKAWVLSSTLRGLFLPRSFQDTHKQTMKDDLALCFSIFVFSNECNCQDQISGFLDSLILIPTSRHVKLLKDSEAEEPAAKTKISFQPHTLIQPFKLPLREWRPDVGFYWKNGGLTLDRSLFPPPELEAGQLLDAKPARFSVVGSTSLVVRLSLDHSWSSELLDVTRVGM